MEMGGIAKCGPGVGKQFVNEEGSVMKITRKQIQLKLLTGKKKGVLKNFDKGHVILVRKLGSLQKNAAGRVVDSPDEMAGSRGARASSSGGVERAVDLTEDQEEDDAERLHAQAEADAERLAQEEAAAERLAAHLGLGSEDEEEPEL